MRSLLFGLLLALGACSSSSSDTAPGNASVNASEASPSDMTSVPAGQSAVAYFAGGCFWGVEHFLEQLDGVHSVESGYMGGNVDNPSYKQVVYEGTGHLEAVRVRYDASKVDYETVAKLFFEIHDPTQANGQGPDIGAQYLSAVFYADATQRRVTDKLIGQLRERGYDVATTVRPASTFWLAEDYHQDYYAKSGSKPYCHARVRRFGD